jgi:hypothetical protein
MDKLFFEKQIEKIAFNFGKQNYSLLKRNLLYDQMKHFENNIFLQSVDRLITSYRLAPQIDDFVKVYDELSAQHKRRELEKSVLQIPSNRQGSIFTAEEIKMFFSTMFKAISGELPKADLALLSEYIKTKLENAGIKYSCPKCEDKGLIFEDKENGSEYVYRCDCAIGNTQPQKYPKISLQ